MAEIEVLIGEILRQRRSAEPRGRATSSTRSRSRSPTSPQPRRDQLVARDVIVLHLGAQSNLYAALAWTLANLLAHPDDLARVRAGDDDLLERYAYESIRMAQRSHHAAPGAAPDRRRRRTTATYRLAPGVLITTMLSVTNTTPRPGPRPLRPRPLRGPPARASPASCPPRSWSAPSATGSHTCPAQRFSISAIRVAVYGLLDAYELTPQFTSPRPLTRQIGGVARADRPTPVRYLRRRR